MHKSVTPYDELELAFYWLLLAPQRTRQDEPRGIVVLRRDGLPVSVEVKIGTPPIKRVFQLLEEVRAARETRVTPRICGCNVCANVRKQEVRSYAAEHRDVPCSWASADPLPAHSTLPVSRIMRISLGETQSSSRSNCGQRVFTALPTLFGFGSVTPAPTKRAVHSSLVTRFPWAPKSSLSTWSTLSLLLGTCFGSAAS